MNEEKECDICGKKLKNESGNIATPIINKGTCCDDCNKFVLIVKQKEELRTQSTKPIGEQVERIICEIIRLLQSKLIKKSLARITLNKTITKLVILKENIKE